MCEKPYRQINITEIANRADLSRRTFYRHFKTTNDVLAYHLQMISEPFVDILLSQSKNDMETMVLIYFQYWEQHKSFLLLLKDNGLLYLLLEHFLPAVKEKLSAYHQNDMNIEVILYVYYFMAGGLWNLLVKWIEDGAKLNPHEIADIVPAIINNLR